MQFKLPWAGAFATAVALCAQSSAAAPPNEGMCAVQQAVHCGAYETCERTLPASVNLPALMRYDLSAGTVESRFADSGRTSKIASSSTEGEALMLQGVDGAHPWSIRVNTKSGAFTLSVLREEETFIGFGVCSSSILK